MKKISICIPCYNEEANILPLYEQISAQFKQLAVYRYEIIFADNDSQDNSQEVLKQLAAKDAHVKVILNMKNYGFMRSQKNCTFRATGDAVIGMTCDFQDPPELIPVFIKEWEKGHLAVMGQKLKRNEYGFIAICRTLFYKLTNALSNTNYYDHVTGFGLYDRTVIEQIRQLDEPDISIRHLIPELGYHAKLIPYEQIQRKTGKSSFNFIKYARLAFTSLLHTSTTPLKFVTTLGMVTAFISFLLGMLYLVYKFLRWDTFSAGIAPILIGLFFLGGIQLGAIGLVGEYVCLIIKKMRQNPLVIEKEAINFENYENNEQQNVEER